MRGLLVKDIRLLANQKQFFIMIVLISVMLAGTGQDLLFIISYITMLSAFFTVSTINYDEFNNGFAFLFTMPVSRRGYAMEKYLFALAMGGVAWAVSTVFSGIYLSQTDPAWNGGEWMLAALEIFMILGVIVAVMLPIQLKFGVEKSRAAMVIFALVLMAVLMLAGKIKEFISPEWMMKLSSLNVSMMGIFVSGVVIFAAALLISINISVRIMEKKQF